MGVPQQQTDKVQQQTPVQTQQQTTDADWEDLAGPPDSVSSTAESASASSTALPGDAAAALPAESSLPSSSKATPDDHLAAPGVVAFLTSKGLGTWAEKLVVVTDAEQVEDLRLIDTTMAEEVVAGLKLVPAQKFRALLKELRGGAKAPGDGGAVDTAEPGDYVVSYSCRDAAGNEVDPRSPSAIYFGDALAEVDGGLGVSPSKKSSIGRSSTSSSSQAPLPPALEEAIVACIDRSGSMRSPFSTDRTRMEAVKQMFYAFRDRTETVARGAHEIGLVQFDEKIDRMLDLSRRLDHFEDIVDDMEHRGLTAIYSAVLEGVRMLAPVAERSPSADLRVLVLTDGQNNTGVGPGEALREARKIGAVVDAIIVGDRPDANLRKIVTATGGECYQIKDLGEGFELLEAEGVVSLRARRGGGAKPPFFRPSEAALQVDDLDVLQEREMTRGTAVARAPALAPALATKRVVGVQDAFSSLGADHAATAGGHKTTAGMKRIRSELAKVARGDKAVWMHTGEGVHVFPAAEDLSLWRALLEGPAGSPFEGGVFALNVVIPQDYPLRPPHVTFETPIYHCNVSDSGKVCLDILYDSWSPALTVPKCLEAVRLMMKNPDTDNALRQWIAELTIAHQKNGETEYFTKAREATQRDAGLSVAGWQQRWGC